MRLASSIWAVWVLVFLGSSSILAQENGDRLREVMEDLRDAYMMAYNAHDAQATAALYTEDADVVFPNGDVLRGRQEIRRELESTFTEYPNVRIEIAPKGGRIIGRRVLLVDGISEFTNGPPALPARTAHTVVFLRGQDDHWRIAAIRISIPVQRPE